MGSRKITVREAPRSRVTRHGGRVAVLRLRKHNGCQPRGRAAACGHSRANERGSVLKRYAVIECYPVTERAYAIKRAVDKQETRKDDIGIWQVLYLARRRAGDRRKAEAIHTKQIRSCRKVKALCEVPDNCCEQG